MERNEKLFLQGYPILNRAEKESKWYTLVYMGNKQFIHLQGYVQIGSFDKRNKAFDEFNINRLLFAVNLFPFVNHSGNDKINTTLTNLPITSLKNKQYEIKQKIIPKK
jgi:hypothetical protein